METQILQNQHFQISEETSKRITSLRFLLIVLVVFIHANLKADDALNYYKLDFIQPKWIEIVKNFISGTLGGAAVPLFFLFASYIQFSKKDKYVCLLRKRSKSILLPYILWTVITIILYLIAHSIPQTALFFQNPNNIIKNWNILDYLKAFAYHDFSMGLKSPLVYQFWFLRELMIFIVLSPIFVLMCKKFGGGLLVLISVFAITGTPLYFTVSTSAFFFYLAGYYFATYEIDFFKIADKLKITEYIVLLILSEIFSVCFGGKYSWGFVKIIISCLFFLKLSKYLVANEKLFLKLKYLSGYSFFLYAVHTPFLGTSINKISWKIIPLHGIMCLVQFFVAALLTIIIGTSIGIILNKICPPLFKLLNGGRK